MSNSTAALGAILALFCLGAVSVRAGDDGPLHSEAPGAGTAALGTPWSGLCESATRYAKLAVDARRWSEPGETPEAAAELTLGALDRAGATEGWTDQDRLSLSSFVHGVYRSVFDLAPSQLDQAESVARETCLAHVRGAERHLAKVYERCQLRGEIVETISRMREAGASRAFTEASLADTEGQVPPALAEAVEAAYAPRAGSPVEAAAATYQACLRKNTLQRFGHE